MSSWADFAKSALDRLGSLAPLVIIAGLAAFGVYKLQEQNTENYERLSETAKAEREQARKDFETANSALKETYNATNQLYTSMLTSMSNTLERMRELESTLQTKQKTFLKSELENERRKIELESLKKELKVTQADLHKNIEQAAAQRTEAKRASAAAAKANIAADEADKRAAQLKAKLAQDRSQLNKTREDLEGLQKELKVKRDEFDRAVLRLTEVRGLVGEVAQLSPGATVEQIESLTERAREITPKLADFLKRYVDDPTSRHKLDPSELVGLKLSELRTGLQSSSRIAWFIYSDKPDLKIAALPLDVRGRPHLPSVLFFTISNASVNSVARFLRTTKEDSSVADKPIARAFMDYTIAIKCVGTHAFDEMYYWKLSRNTAAGTATMAISDELDLREMLGNFSKIVPVWPSNEQGDWKFRYLTPREATKEAPETVKLNSEIWGPHISAGRCLSFLNERDRLTRTKIFVEGLTAHNNMLIADRLTSIFQSVFHSNQDFSEPISLSRFADGTANSGLQNFLPLVAVDALQSKTGTPRSHLLAKRDNDAITVGFVRKQRWMNSPSSIRLKIANGKIRFLGLDRSEGPSASVAPNL